MSTLLPLVLNSRICPWGAGEGFNNYAQKWRYLAGRVQPLLSDRELVDMFLGTLSGSFFNHLIDSASSGFTELILTGERVEAGIRSGKYRRMPLRVR